MWHTGFSYAEWEMRNKQRTLLREAEGTRRSRQASAGAEGSHRLSRRAVARLGDWLVGLGCRLQEHRGGALAASSSPGATSP